MSSRTDGGWDARVDILMYHSIASDPGPTSIPVDLFRQHMEALVESGANVVPLVALAAWQRGELSLPERTVVITFDDGFQDFADAAFPFLQQHRLAATVFLPTGCLGGSESWVGKNSPPRKLMSWSTVVDLAAAGVDFGGHSVTHADLTALPLDRLQDEIKRSQAEIGERLGRPTETFAPPYGRSDARVRAELARHSRVSVGTGLDRARRDADLTDAPRIEMHYFRIPALFRAYLAGRADWYLSARQLGRRARALAVARRASA